MNEYKIVKLSTKIVNLVQVEAQRAELSLGEINAALGEAIGIINYEFAVREMKAELPREPEPEDEEEDEDEELFRRCLTDDEKLFAYARLSAFYPHEVVCLVGSREMKYPEWLKKEIVERRG